MCDVQEFPFDVSKYRLIEIFSTGFRLIFELISLDETANVGQRLRTVGEWTLRNLTE